jgi:ribosome-binding factor A
MTGLCAEPSEDDGFDPHHKPWLAAGPRHARPSTRSRIDRKVLQLCHQVAETLEEVLAECGDALLQSLRVLDVEPAPDASRLLVTVATGDLPEGKRDLGRVQDHLARASGHLRSEVATAITRKRTPMLIYRVTAEDVQMGM